MHTILRSNGHDKCHRYLKLKTLSYVVFCDNIIQERIEVVVNDALTNAARWCHLRCVHGQLAIAIGNHRQWQCDCTGFVPGVLRLIERAGFCSIHCT